MTEHLIVSDEAATRIIRMNRPDKKNALTQTMYSDMADAIDSAKDNASIKCILISGGPDAFTAGNDLADFLKDGTSTSDPAFRSSKAMVFLRALANNTKPLVAAVDGVAIGIGTTMLFHCDYVVAGEKARFATPFINLGLVPEGASSLLFPRTMGHQRAFATLVMGRSLTAQAGRDAGFVNDVVAAGQAESEARKIADEISALPQEAVALSRKLIKPAPAELIARIEEESALFGQRMKSQEAITAFKTFFARK